MSQRYTRTLLPADLHATIKKRAAENGRTIIEEVRHLVANHPGRYLTEDESVYHVAGPGYVALRKGGPTPIVGWLTLPGDQHPRPVVGFTEDGTVITAESSPIWCPDGTVQRQGKA